MTKRTSHDALMIRYLLGEATEQEQQRLEEQFFADDERYQELLAIEDELRYEYAQGGLAPEQRKSFEKRFLNSAEDRQKVALAKAVLTKAYEAHKEALALAPAREESPTWWQSFTRLLVPQAPGIRFSYAGAALAIVVLAGGSWLMLQTSQLRNQVGQLQAERRIEGQRAQQQIAAQRAQQDELNKRLGEERAKRGELEQQLAKRQGTFLSFVLIPGLTRDADGLKRLVVPADTGEVRLQLDVKSKESYKSYRAELQTLDGDVLWSQSVDQPTLAITARFLKSGDFVIALKGIGPSGEPADAGEFYFQIVKR